MTDEQRRRRPPVVHPVFLPHPITGCRVLYCNPGFTVRINELSQQDSDEMLEYLFVHQLRAEIPLYQRVDRERPLDVGPSRHDSSRHRRLPPGRDPPDPALPGHGDKGVRPGIPALGSGIRLHRLTLRRRDDADRTTPIQNWPGSVATAMPRHRPRQFAPILPGAG